MAGRRRAALGPDAERVESQVQLSLGHLTDCTVPGLAVRGNVPDRPAANRDSGPDTPTPAAP
ncbi:hypothetical protein AAFF_G00093580 [Aldrovandia affinis]|uniref:Uncharacterized protein n=1 Tax=Aldrovandia affinis TaxID=143900 RepID=A0AAD7T3Z4_9TELE|nr:hypothetical protein AAFF_G00093580 [Aldrovandia affinis]